MMPGKQPYCPRNPSYSCAVGVEKLIASNERLIRLVHAIHGQRDEARRAELMEDYAAASALYPAKCGACRYSKTHIDYLEREAALA
jgi:hypothetical protein